MALRAYHDAIRLGDRRAADPVARLAAEIRCPVGDMVLNHGRALADGDSDGLQAASDQLAAIGMRAAAADAATQARVLS